MSTITRATLDDLSLVEGKAELIAGRIVAFMPTGDLPSDVANEIFVSLRAHAKKTGQGVAKADGVGYAVPELPSGRESFSPDVSYYTGPRPANRMRFIQGPPTFAAEVRSENDYTEAAEADMAAKRLDYFTAGTLVVWDVDPQAETVAVYRATDPDNPASNVGTTSLSAVSLALENRSKARCEGGVQQRSGHSDFLRRGPPAR